MSLPVPELGGNQAISHTDGRLAWEIAAEVSDVPTILVRYGISAAQFREKLKDQMFRTALREAKSLWKSDMNVQQRLRLKAAFLVEDSLLDVFKIIKNENSGAAAKLEAFEKLMKTADLNPKSSQTPIPVGAGFKVNIIMGPSPTQKVTIDAHAIEASPVEAA
jgi:hypothetical protein